MSHIALEDHRKQSRRTTRMLRKALEAQFNCVVVVGANMAHCVTMARMTFWIASVIGVSVKMFADRVITTDKTVLFVPDGHRDAIRGLSHDTPVFTDHYVYHLRSLKRAENYKLN